MSDNIAEVEIDFDQLESEHGRMLEKVRLDKALDEQNNSPKEEKSEKKQESNEDIIKLNSWSAGAPTNYMTWDPHDTSTWNASTRKVEDESISMNRFDEMYYDPYDIGSGNYRKNSPKSSRYQLANTENIWDAHAWPDDDSSGDDPLIGDLFDAGFVDKSDAPKGKFWVTGDRKWLETDSSRPLTNTNDWDEQEDEDLLSLVQQTAEEIKDCVENVSCNVENLDNDLQEISMNAKFMSNTVSGLDSRMKKLEMEMKHTRQEVGTIRGLLEIIIQYYTASDEEDDGKQDMT